MTSIITSMNKQNEQYSDSDDSSPPSPVTIRINRKWTHRKRRKLKDRPMKKYHFRLTEHELISAPKHAVFDVEANKWIANQLKQKYQKYSCTICKIKKIRTYCKCNVGVWMCHSCHVRHCVMEEMEYAVHCRFMPLLIVHELKEVLQMPKVQRYCNKSIDRAKQHKLEVAPKHAASYDPNNGWVLSSKNPYPSYLCSSCWNKRTRNVCSCDKQSWICRHCHAEHTTQKSLKLR